MRIPATSNWRRFGLTFVAGAATIFPPLAGAFTAEEVLVANPAFGIPDPEFDEIGDRVTWQDRSDTLWVAPVDPLTGDFKMDQAVQLDTGLAPIPSIKAGTGTGNGPEWICTGSEPQIIYTKSFGSGANSWFLYRAKRHAGQWEVGPLPGSDQLPFGANGMSGIGSLKPGDSSPKVCYLLSGGPGHLYPLAWRQLDHPIGNLVSQKSIFTGRWINRESNAFIFVQDAHGTDQAFIYDVQLNTSTQITFSPGNKVETAIWRAPEFSNQSLLMSQELLPSGRSQIGIYQQSNGQWNKINTLVPPTSLLSLRSPEPFVYNGQSYILFLAENGKGEPSEVWIAGIRPDAPFYRRLSPLNVILVRNDPEFFAAETTGFVYYQNRDDSSVHRANTGLGPPTSNTINGTEQSEALAGTAASDRIFGGRGSDTLTGNGGRDHFVYEKEDEGSDSITDFIVNEDVINMTLLMARFGYQGANPISDGYVILTKLGKDAVISIDPDGRRKRMAPRPLITLRGVTPADLENISNFVF